MGKLKELLINTEDGDEEAKRIKEGHTLVNIAIVKSYNYCEEYNSTTGGITEKHGAMFLKQGYIDGFLAGFTHKFTGETDG